MIDLFTVSWEIRAFITFLLGLCVLMQTLTIVSRFHFTAKTKGEGFQRVFEIFVLGEIFVFAVLHGEVVNGYEDGMIVIISYLTIRIALFAILFILALVIYVLDRVLSPLLLVFVFALALPPTEHLWGAFFPWVFVGILLFTLLRSITIYITSFIAMRTHISALSINHTLNTLHSGVLLCESNGYIVLSNHQMQRLMLLTTGKVFHNGNEFYDMLTLEEHGLLCKKVQLEGQAVYLLPNNRAWIFKKTETLIRQKKYCHISATDVSERWALTIKLQRQDLELRKISQELKETISNLHILSKEKEIEKAKMRAHDILGQRLTVLLRMIQNEASLDYDLLTSLSKGLLDELKKDHVKSSALEELERILQVFSTIHVDIDFQGKLPEEENLGYLLVDIIREATTNAVRHGFATQIKIKIEPLKTKYMMTISNPGSTLTEPIVPGGGLTTMRKKVEAYGGDFTVTTDPQFTLSIVLPGGCENE